MTVTLLLWIAQSWTAWNMLTMYLSVASKNWMITKVTTVVYLKKQFFCPFRKNFNKKLPCKHIIAETWKRYSFPEILLEISLTSLMKGSFLISKSVLFWYFWIAFKLFVWSFFFGGDFLRLILEIKRFFYLDIFLIKLNFSGMKVKPQKWVHVIINKSKSKILKFIRLRENFLE